MEDKHLKKTRKEVEGQRTLFAILGGWILPQLFILKLIMEKIKHLPFIFRRNSSLYLVNERKLVCFSLSHRPSLCRRMPANVERRTKLKLSWGNPNEIIDPGNYHQWILKLSRETEYLHGICFLNNKPLKIHQCRLKVPFIFSHDCKFGRTLWSLCST